MELSEKLWILRTKNQLSREELAEVCDVSVQAVTKWENGDSIPKVEKLILISEIFGISVDALIKGDMNIGEPKGSHCSSNCIVQNKNSALFEGILIKESLESDGIIDLLNIHKVELWKTESIPKYWTALTFTSSCVTLAEKISKSLVKPTGGKGIWFADFKSNNTKYIVFRDTILKYEIGNKDEKDSVCSKCLELGIPEHQMNWGE